MNQAHQFEGGLRWTGAVREVEGKLKIERAIASHDKAHANCFMTNSVNFEVKVQPVVAA